MHLKFTLTPERERDGEGNDALLQCGRYPAWPFHVGRARSTAGLDPRPPRRIDARPTTRRTVGDFFPAVLRCAGAAPKPQRTAPPRARSKRPPACDRTLPQLSLGMRLARCSMGHHWIRARAPDAQGAG